MKAGEELTVEQALYALLLYSANEVAYALAEKVAGSIDAFVDMMNNKARELGAIETHLLMPVAFTILTTTQVLTIWL